MIQTYMHELLRLYNWGDANGEFVTCECGIVCYRVSPGLAWEWESWVVRAKVSFGGLGG